MERMVLQVPAHVCSAAVDLAAEVLTIRRYCDQDSEAAFPPRSATDVSGNAGC